MPESLWEAVEAHVPSVHHDRSSWIRMLVTDALSKANALPCDPATVELARARELIASVGPEAVRAKLDELVEATVAEAAEIPA